MEIIESLGFVDRRRGSRRLCGVSKCSKIHQVVGKRIMSATDLARKFIWFPWALLVVSALLALVNRDVYDSVRFWWTPVVTMSGSVVGPPSGGEVLVHMKGQKNRGVECRYIEIQSYGKRFAGPDADLRMVRVDIPETGATKGKGYYDIGVWKIWPVDKTVLKGIEVFVTHNCNGTFVSTKVAEVKL